MTDLKLFLVSWGNGIDYGTYDSFVVCASSEEEAMNTHPEGGTIDWERERSWCGSVWCANVQDVNVKYLGLAGSSIGRGVVCASFNAG